MQNEIVTIGFDPSLNAPGWAILRGKELVACGTEKPKKSLSQLEKLSRVCEMTLSVLASQGAGISNETVVIGVEEERVRSSSTAAVIGEVIGVIKACCMVNHGFVLSAGRIGSNVKMQYVDPPPIIDVHPQKARSLILGYATKEKDRILAQVQMMFPNIHVPDHNAADAVVVALYAYNSFLGLV